jgi:hypothetical protein
MNRRRHGLFQPSFFDLQKKKSSNPVTVDRFFLILSELERITCDNPWLSDSLQRFTLVLHTHGEPPLTPPPKGGEMDARLLPPFRRGGVRGGAFASAPPRAQLMSKPL